MIGTKLAHYEITSHLGSGGMADVYQATDSKLGRSVAVKFLPEALACDSDSYIWIPDPPEQHAIVERIETFELAIKVEEGTLSKLQQLKSGLMADLLTGRVRVPETFEVSRQTT